LSLIYLKSVRLSSKSPLLGGALICYMYGGKRLWEGHCFPVLDINVDRWSLKLLMYLQGVPRNNLCIYLIHSVVDFFNSHYDSWNNNHKILLVLGFPKCVLSFKNFVGIWTKLIICPLILWAQKKADHILEMPRLKVFCDHYF